MTKRIMRDFRIAEISAVDKPAQKGARMTIMKRDDAGTLADVIAKQEVEGARSFGEVLSENEERRRHWEAQEELWPLFGALQESLETIAADESMDRESKLARIRTSVDEFLTAVRDKWPDVEEELSKLFADPAPGGPNAGDPPGSTPHQKGDIMSEDATKKVGELETQVAELNKKVEGFQQENETLKAEKAEAEAIAKLSDAERAYYDTLDKAEDKKRFRDMTDEERKKAVAKAAEADEVVTLAGGGTVRKSAVGADQFAIFKAQEARLAKQEEDLRKERAERQMADFRKQADDEYAHVPGSTDERAHMLKAIAALDDEDVRKSFEAVFTAHEKLAKGAFNRVGHGDGQVAAGSAEDKLEKLAKDHAAKHGISVAKAYDAVLNTDEGRALYNEQRLEKRARAT